MITIIVAFWDSLMWSNIWTDVVEYSGKNILFIGLLSDTKFHVWDFCFLLAENSVYTVMEYTLFIFLANKINLKANLISEHI